MIAPLGNDGVGNDGFGDYQAISNGIDSMEMDGGRSVRLEMSELNNGVESSHESFLSSSEKTNIHNQYTAVGFDGYHASHDDDDVFIITDNLDDFFSEAYNYFYEHGLACILTKGVVNIVTLGFTVWFSTFLIGFVDWSALLSCEDEASCLNFVEYVVWLGGPEASLGFKSFIVTYFWVLFAYWTWTVSDFWRRACKAWDMSGFFLKRLHMSTRELQTMEWHQVVDRLIAVQEKGEHPIQINGSGFTAKDVAMRVLRKQNYMVAMVNERVLPVNTIFLGDGWFLGKNLELMIEFAVFESMFDSQCQVRREFLRGASDMRKRFKVLGFLNLVLMPFSIFFFLIYSFMKYAQEWHSKRNYLGPRWWTPFALWELREYNEMPHILEKRSAAAVRHADDYIKQFPSPVPTVVAGGVSFVTGAIVGVLMLFTILDEAILLHIKLDGRAFVWYIAVFSGVLAISRSLVPNTDQQSLFNPDKAMRRIVSFSHYFPDRWRFSAHTFDVRDEFCEYFPFKVVLLARELVCILSTPYVLCFVLPLHCDRIIEFVEARTQRVPGVGDVCVYSTLNLSENGDERFGSKRSKLSELHDRSSSVGRSFVNVSRHTASDGKLEKSWLSFKLNYPTWTDNQDLTETLSSFQRETVNGLARIQRQFANGMMAGSSSSSYDEMSASFTAAADIERRHNERQAASTGSPAASHADHDFFTASDAIVQPLGAFQYPNAENYYYWLEEFRDNNRRQFCSK